MGFLLYPCPASLAFFYKMNSLPQFLSSASLAQSETPSHSALTLPMQAVALHWKFPLQFMTATRDGQIIKHEIYTSKSNECCRNDNMW